MKKINTRTAVDPDNISCIEVEQHIDDEDLYSMKIALKRGDKKYLHIRYIKYKEVDRIFNVLKIF